MNWSRIDCLILDVDGTLYAQRAVRVCMLFRLVSYYMCRPHRLRELLALQKFRKMREDPEWKNAGTDALCTEIGRKYALPSDRVHRTVSYWMFKNPLDLLKEHAYRDVIDFSNRLRAEGRQIYIYSDYPAEDKLQAMGVEFDRLFYYGQPEIREQKPSRTAMEYILSQIGCSPDRIVYIGDRDEKDRASADLAGIQYYDIQDFRILLKKSDQK